MKKIILIPIGAIILIIAIVALCVMMNVKEEVKPAEMPENEPINDIIETVTEEPSEKEETPTEPSTEATKPSETESVYTAPSEQQIIPVPVQEETVPTATPKEPTQEEAQSETAIQESVGIVIGTPEPESVYSCGVAGHRCSGPEAHAFICELEQKGCDYCCSHTCPSFYALDEWGQSSYTPSVCPKYDIHKDPVYYCQTCNKPCGDGANGTCVQYINACICPGCGEQVPAWTCHYCG